MFQTEMMIEGIVTDCNFNLQIIFLKAALNTKLGKNHASLQNEWHEISCAEKGGTKSPKSYQTLQQKLMLQEHSSLATIQQVGKTEENKKQVKL